MSTCSPPPLMFGSSLMTAARHCICQPESFSVAPSLNEPFIWRKEKGQGEWMTKLLQVTVKVHAAFPQVLFMTKSEPASQERRQTHPAHTWAHSIHNLTDTTLLQVSSTSKRVTITSYTMQESRALGIDDAMRIQHQNVARALTVTRWRRLALAEQLLPRQFLWLALDDIQHKSERFARYCIQ